MTNIDWRVKSTVTITKDVPPSQGFADIKKGNILTLVSNINISKKKTLTIPVPSLTALYISNSEKNWSAYRKIRTHNKIDSSIKKQIEFYSNKEAFDALEALSTSVISAYTAIESFCNDSIPEDHEYWHHNRSEIILEKADKKTIERHFSTSSKLNDVLPKIYGVDRPKGKSPVWVSYVKLKKCRDALIHTKSHETRSSLGDKNNLWDKLFKIEKPHTLAKDIFNWYIAKQKDKPVWYIKYPK